MSHKKPSSAKGKDARKEEVQAEMDWLLSDGLTDLGHVLERTGDVEKALLVFKEAVERAPKSALCWYNHGDALLSVGRPDEAADALRKAVKLAPEVPLYRYDLGLALYELQRYEEAAKYFSVV